MEQNQGEKKAKQVKCLNIDSNELKLGSYNLREAAITVKVTALYDKEGDDETILTTSILRRRRQRQQQRREQEQCLAKVVVQKSSYLILLILLNYLLPTIGINESSALIQVPNRHTVASIPGDLVIGILVPVHERPSPKQAQTRTCGTVREQYGIQRVEAAFRTIDSINSDPNILPNITLGIEIRDSCWHSPIALEQSIEFIRDAMAASEQTQGKSPLNIVPASLPAIGSSLTTATTITTNSNNINSATADLAAATGNASVNSICAPLLMRQQQQQQQIMQAKKVKNIVGVVGPASSTDTVQVQNLLQLFNMPQVGYSATSRDLSNKNFFKYFLRVVPSDKLQAQVMIDLMLAYNWTYITVAYTEGSYGSSLMNAFRERAQEVGICFATLESMPPNADDAKFDELIDAIQKHPNARVVICMCEGRTVGRLFAGFKRKNITNQYLVVGSDGWSDRFDVVEKQEEFALGGISIRIHSAYVNDFDDYYFALNPFTNHRNPWFAEFWETRFQCNLELYNNNNNNNNVQTSNLNRAQHQQRPFVRPPGSKIHNRTCTGRESLRNNHKQDAKMAFVQKSIITMAFGLDSMQRAICPPNKPGLCPEMLPVNGSILLQHLMNVSFSFLDEEVYFDEQGDPPGKYEILNFQRRRPINTDSNGQFTYENLDVDHGSLLNQQQAQLEPSSSLMSSYESSIINSTNDKRRLNPLYDSYSTLKVYRPQQQQQQQQQQTQQINPSSSSTVSSTPGRVVSESSPPTPGRRQQRGVAARIRQQPAPHNPPASGYSSTSGYEYVHVGSWKSSDGLSLFGDIHWPSSDLLSEHYNNFGQFGPHSGADGSGSQTTTNMIEFPGKHLIPNKPPKSVCSLPCAMGHAKKIQSDSVKCCWVCVACRPNEYLFNEFKCKACEKGWWPNLMRTGCEQISIQYLDWRSMEALTAISIALFGLVLTIATAIVFIKHNNTPVVKSSTRELSYMILFAMFVCYVNTFLLVLKPSKITCLVTRILPGFAFAMMYGALVTKTNRIARILAGSKKKIITRRLRFMSATSQMAITWIIVLIECLIIIFMLIREPPDKMHDYPSDERVVLVCNTTTVGIIAPLGFDFFLIAMCTLYAFKTRNVPENFNEAKFIGFTMYTTIVIWIAFVVIYLSSEHKVTTLSLCISFSALFALFLLFFPRCYIIIFKPEKNNRSYFTTTKNVRCHIGYKIGSAGAAAAAAAANAAAASPNQGQVSSNQMNSNTTTVYQQQQQISKSMAASAAAANASRQHQFATSKTTASLDFEQYDQAAATQTEELLSRQQQQQQSRLWQTSALHWNKQQRQQRKRGSEGEPQQQQSAWNSRRGRGRVGPASEGESLENCGDTVGNFRPTSNSLPIEGAQQKQPLTRWVTSILGQDKSKSFRTNNENGSVISPGTFVRSLFVGFLSIFSRRSRRKEFDKASSIQQHLRAIRHAENLDRQTHFRRSQVQRLVQRFDSSGNNDSASGGQFVNQFQLESGLNWSNTSAITTVPTGTANSCIDSSPSSILPTANTADYITSNLYLSRLYDRLKGEDLERLMMALSQLIGVHNMWRLYDTLQRHYLQRDLRRQEEQEKQLAHCGQPAELSGTRSVHCIDHQTPLSMVSSDNNNNNINNNTRLVVPPLNFEEPEDRKLALVLLRFLAEVASKSSEEMGHSFRLQQQIFRLPLSPTKLQVDHQTERDGLVQPLQHNYTGLAKALPDKVADRATRKGKMTTTVAKKTIDEAAQLSTEDTTPATVKSIVGKGTTKMSGLKQRNDVCKLSSSSSLKTSSYKLMFPKTSRPVSNTSLEKDFEQDVCLKSSGNVLSAVTSSSSLLPPTQDKDDSGSSSSSSSSGNSKVWCSQTTKRCYNNNGNNNKSKVKEDKREVEEDCDNYDNGNLSSSSSFYAKLGLLQQQRRGRTDEEEDIENSNEEAEKGEHNLDVKENERKFLYHSTALPLNQPCHQQHHNHNHHHPHHNRPHHHHHHHHDDASKFAKESGIPNRFTNNTSKNDNNEENKQEDPIKRALDCIMGSNATPDSGCCDVDNKQKNLNKRLPTLTNANVFHSSIKSKHVVDVGVANDNKTETCQHPQTKFDACRFCLPERATNSQLRHHRDMPSRDLLLSSSSPKARSTSMKVATLQPEALKTVKKGEEVKGTNQIEMSTETTMKDQKGFASSNAGPSTLELSSNNKHNIVNKDENDNEDEKIQNEKKKLKELTNKRTNLEEPVMSSPAANDDGAHHHHHHHHLGGGSNVSSFMVKQEPITSTTCPPSKPAATKTTMKKSKLKGSTSSTGETLSKQQHEHNRDHEHNYRELQASQITTNERQEEQQQQQIRASRHRCCRSCRLDRVGASSSSCRSTRCRVKDEASCCRKTRCCSEMCHRTRRRPKSSSSTLQHKQQQQTTCNSDGKGNQTGSHDRLSATQARSSGGDVCSSNTLGSLESIDCCKTSACQECLKSSPSAASIKRLLRNSATPDEEVNCDNKL